MGIKQHLNTTDVPPTPSEKARIFILKQQKTVIPDYHTYTTTQCCSTGRL